MSYFDPICIHPREVWNTKHCEKFAKRSDSFSAYRGLLVSHSDPYACYGCPKAYNGGKVIDDVWYKSEMRPFPKIPDEFVWVSISSWGYHLRKRDTVQPSERIIDLNDDGFFDGY